MVKSILVLTVSILFTLNAFSNECADKKAKLKVTHPEKVYGVNYNKFKEYITDRKVFYSVKMAEMINKIKDSIPRELKSVGSSLYKPYDSSDLGELPKELNTILTELITKPKEEGGITYLHCGEDRDKFLGKNDWEVDPKRYWVVLEIKEEQRDRTSYSFDISNPWQKSTNYNGVKVQGSLLLFKKICGPTFNDRKTLYKDGVKINWVEFIDPEFGNQDKSKDKVKVCIYDKNHVYREIPISNYTATSGFECIDIYLDSSKNVSKISLFDNRVVTPTDLTFPEIKKLAYEEIDTDVSESELINICYNHRKNKNPLSYNGFINCMSSVACGKNTVFDLERAKFLRTGI